MKKFLVTVAAAALMSVVAGAASAQAVKISVSAEPYPPFASLDAAGKWVGWEVEIAMALCEAAQLQCELVATPWDGIIPALTSKKIDAIAASMSITEERKKTIDFSNKYYNVPASIAAAKGGDIKPTPEGLKGKIIGVQVSTIHEAYAKKHFPDAAEIKIYQTQDEANADLAAGRIDATQAESMALDAFLASDQGKACCESKGNVADDPAVLGLGVGIGVRQEDTALRDKFNGAIETIRSNGKFDEISKKYFNFDIYGG